MNIRRILACLLGALLLPAAAHAQYYYTSDGSQVTITGYYGSGGALAITNLIDGLPVTGIGDQAFDFTPSLTSVTIPGTITNIAGDAFVDCEYLISFTVNPTNLYYTNVGGVLFNKSLTTLVECPGGLAGPYIVPNGVTSVGDYAFEDCDGLTGVTITNGVTTIGSSAFDSCLYLASAKIGGSVTNIGDDAFSPCPMLTNIAVNAANPVYSSGGGVLFDKNQTTLIVCPAGLSGKYTVSNTVTSIAGDAFALCSGLTSITITNGVTSLGSGVFNFCTGLTNLTIPNSVTNLGDQLFENCLILNHVTISTNVTSLGFAMFFDCYQLDGITIPDSVTSIGDDAFGYTGLTNITIPDGVTNIGSAFEQCTNLSSITIPGSVVSLGPAVFTGDTSLTNITVGATNSVYASVGGVLFDKSLTILLQYPAGLAGSYTVPGGVTNIADYAFADNGGLTNVTIPGSVLGIGDDVNPLAGDAAFAQCPKLLEIHFLGNSPALGQSDVFYGDTLAKVYYQAGTTGWSTTYGGLPTVMLGTAPPPGYDQITSQLVNGGNLRLSFVGNANAAYALDRTFKLSPPNWVPQVTNTTDGSGMLVFTNTPLATTNNFWRIRSVP